MLKVLKNNLEKSTAHTKPKKLQKNLTVIGVDYPQGD